MNKELWSKRLTAARKRREEQEAYWRWYYKIYRDAELSLKAKNDDVSVNLPNGDRVKLHLVFRNIEQTLSMLEASDVVVDATSVDSDRLLDAGDVHNEKILEKTLRDGIIRSGVLSGKFVADRVKRDGLICGHGISYSYYRIVNDEVDTVVPVYEVSEGSNIVTPVFDENGAVKTRKEKRKTIVYESVEEEHVSPFCFLFDADSDTLDTSFWHGREKVVSLEELKKDDRFNIPSGLHGASLKRKDYFESDPSVSWDTGADLVLQIDVFDTQTRQLLTFVEGSVQKTDESKSGNKESNANKNKGIFDRFRSKISSASSDKPLTEKSLHLVRSQKFPFVFDNPDLTPFNFFVPIPCNGVPFGISQIEHIATPADEADKTQTRIVNALREFKRLWLVRKGRVDTEDLNSILKSSDKNVIEVEAKESDDNLNNLFQEVSHSTLSPELYMAPQAAADTVRQTSGVSDIPLGGADTATEADAMMTVGSARINRKRSFFFSYLTQVAWSHKGLNAAFAPQKQSVRVVGDSGSEEVLSFGREVFQGKYEIFVLPFADASSRSPVMRKMMMDIALGLRGSYGHQFDRLLWRQVFRELDWKNANALVDAIPMGDMAQGPGIPGMMPAAEGVEGVSDGQVLREAINQPYE